MRENFRKIFSLPAQINVTLEGHNHNYIGLYTYLHLKGYRQGAHCNFFSAFKTSKDSHQVSCFQVLLFYWSEGDSAAAASQSTLYPTTEPGADKMLNGCFFKK